MANNGRVDPRYTQRANAANAQNWQRVQQWGSNWLGPALQQSVTYGMFPLQSLAAGAIDAGAKVSRTPGVSGGGRPGYRQRGGQTAPAPSPQPPAPAAPPAPVKDYTDAQGNLYDGSSGRLKQGAAAPAAQPPAPQRPPAATRAAAAGGTMAAVAAAPQVAAVTTPAAAKPSGAPSYEGYQAAAYPGESMLSDATAFTSALKANGGRFDGATFGVGDDTFQKAAAPALEGLQQSPLRPSDGGALPAVGQPQAAAAAGGRAAMSDADLEAAQTRAFMGASDSALGAKAVRELLHGELAARGETLDPNVNKYSIGSLRQMLAKRPGSGAVAQDAIREVPAVTDQGTVVQPFGDGRDPKFTVDAKGLDGPSGSLVPRAEQRYPSLSEVVDGYMTSPTGLPAKLAANPANQVPLDQPATWENANITIDRGTGVNDGALAALASSGLAPAPSKGQEVAAALAGNYGGNQSLQGLYNLGYVDPDKLPPAYSQGMTLPSGMNWWGR